MTYERTTFQKHLALAAGALVAVTVLATASCSDGDGTTSAPDGTTSAPDGAVAATDGGAAGGLSAQVVAALKDGITDEYKAEATYKGVVDKFGAVKPFSNIIKAETRHSAAIAKLYTSHGLAVPANPWATSMSGIPSFTTVKAACAAGVTAEVANIAIYDRLLKLALPSDVKTVFTSNRKASVDSHLPAFRNCAK